MCTNKIVIYINTFEHISVNLDVQIREGAYCPNFLSSLYGEATLATTAAVVINYDYITQHLA